jgi:hypothetical protein
MVELLKKYRPHSPPTSGAEAGLNNFDDWMNNDPV